MMEIPAGRECDGTLGDGSERQYWACPFFSDNDGSEDCAMFGEGLYAYKCKRCLAAYPNGATIEIKPK